MTVSQEWHFWRHSVYNVKYVSDTDRKRTISGKKESFVALSQERVTYGPHKTDKNPETLR